MENTFKVQGDTVSDFSIGDYVEVFSLTDRSHNYPLPLQAVVVQIDDTDIKVKPRNRDIDEFLCYPWQLNHLYKKKDTLEVTRSQLDLLKDAYVFYKGEDTHEESALYSLEGKSWFNIKIVNDDEDKRYRILKDNFDNAHDDLVLKLRLSEGRETKVYKEFKELKEHHTILTYRLHDNIAGSSPKEKGYLDLCTKKNIEILNQNKEIIDLKNKLAYQKARVKQLEKN